MWIFLTVVLTLQVHIKVLSYGAIGAFVETASAVCTLSQWFFFLSKTYCVSFKEWKSLQSIFRDVNQRLVRAETKYKGSECCFCVSYLITRSWVTTRLSLFRDRVWDTNLNHLWGKRCSWTAVWYSSEHKKHILCKRFLALCLNISSSFERVCGCFQVPF